MVRIKPIGSLNVALCMVDRQQRISDGHLEYTQVTGQWYQCPLCDLTVSAREVIEMLHYHRCHELES